MTTGPTGNGWPVAMAEVDVSLCFPSDVRDPALLARYRDFLSPDELERNAAFAFEEPRRLDLVTRALVRCRLSAHVAIDPRAWRFARNRHGRPRIAWPPVAAGLRFNPSHTTDLVACAIVREHDVGLDVEHLGRRLALDRLARVLAPAEADALRALPAERRHVRFLEYWTVKEACLKAQGVGLSATPHRITCVLRDGEAMRLVLRGESSAPHVVLFAPSPVHCAALALRAPAATEIVLRVRRVVPLVSDTAEPVRLLAATGATSGVAPPEGRTDGP